MKNQVIAEVKIIPLGTASTSLSQYVAACLELTQKAQGVTCQLTAMGTIIQGPLKSAPKFTLGISPYSYHRVAFSAEANPLWRSKVRQKSEGTLEQKLRFHKFF